MRPIPFLLVSLVALGACGQTKFPTDFDLRDLGKGFDTSSAVEGQTSPRPQPDSRGVITYPNYQVIVAQPGDRVADVAARVGIDPVELARFNGLPANAVLNQGEVLVLPGRVPAAGGNVDVQTLAGDAIARAPAGATAASPGRASGPEPVRHKVVRGETVYSIARLYGVSAKSLAEWNGLGPNLEVRVGQYLMIPAGAAAPQRNATSAPGVGSPTPVPPSAAEPLPAERTTPPSSTVAGAAPEGTPASPNLGSQATSASAGNARMVTPVSGSIIRDFNKGRNDGIDIAATAGTPVRAADAGTVAAITEDTDNVPIIVLRHSDGLLTVYANVDNLTVKKGQTVGRGESIASVRQAASPFLHFEVRQGVEAVDPDDYLN